MGDIIHDPFLRQLKDYHKYTFHGNLFVYDRISMDVLDIERLDQACGEMVARRSILRTVLFKDGKGLIRCRILPAGDQRFNLQFRPGCPDKEAAFMHEIAGKDLAGIPLSEGPLFRVIVYKSTTRWNVIIYVHHIICELASLMIIKKELIELYNNGVPAVVKVFQFSDYARYRNSQLMDSYEKDISFYADTGLPFSGNCLKKKRSFEEVLEELSHPIPMEIDSSVIGPANSYETIIRIDDFEAMQKILQQEGIRWNSVIMTCFSYVINKLYPQGIKLIGFLFNDRTSKYSVNNIGEFSGECFFNTQGYDVISRDKLRQANLYLYKIYRHLIFNYRFYSIDESRLFRELCPMFVNFFMGDTDFLPDSARINPFEETAPIGCDLQPAAVLCPNGYLLVYWNFKTKIFSRAGMSDINDLFISAFRQIMALLTNK